MLYLNYYRADGDISSEVMVLIVTKYISQPSQLLDMLSRKMWYFVKFVSGIYIDGVLLYISESRRF
jgi:hypothetical protein